MINQSTLPETGGATGIRRVQRGICGCSRFLFIASVSYPWPGGFCPLARSYPPRPLFAGDFVGISETPEGLQKQIEKALTCRIHYEMESDSEREEMRSSCM